MVKLLLSVVAVFLLMSCSNSNPASVVDTPQTIIISSYSLPSGTTSWQYDYSDGSSISSQNYLDLGGGNVSFLFGADTMITKGNSLIGFSYANGIKVIFGGGTGILLEPSEILNGKTYTATSTGYNQDYSFSVKMDVSVKYVLTKNITVGTQTLSDCLYVEMVLSTKDPDNGTLISTETTCEYRAKGLGTVKLLDKSGTVLKSVVKIVANGVTVFQP